MASSYEEWLKKVTEGNKPQQDKEIATVTSVYDTQKKDTQAAYDKAVKDTTLSYEDAYRQNEVQRLVNERAIAENMANLGLTDSGLNRTQQTAVQLSYANQKGSIDRQKQSAVDGLTFNLAQAISEIDRQKTIDIEKINSSYTQFNSERATALRNAELEKEAEDTKNYYSYLTSQAQAQATRNQYNGLPTATQYNQAMEYYNNGNYYALQQLVDDNCHNMTAEQYAHWYSLIEKIGDRYGIRTSGIGGAVAQAVVMAKNAIARLK